MTSPEEPAVSLETDDGGVAIIGLTRPEKRNALRPFDWERIGEHVRACGQDPQVRAIVLTGHGGYFSAGADLRWTGRNLSWPTSDVMHRTILDTYNCPKPILAAVEGCCIGPGWALALACDILVAACTAYFQPPFASHGLIPDAGIAWFLQRRLGYYEAVKLFWFEGRLDCRQAAALGLVTDVTDAGAALSRARDLAAQLSASPARTVAAGKTVMRISCSANLDSVLDAEHDLIASNRLDEEAISSRSRFVATLGGTQSA